MSLLNQKKAERILRKNNIPFCESRIAKSKEDAVRISKKIGFPVVLKALSQDMPHKSDFGGVAVGINNPKELVLCHDRIMRDVKKKKPGIKIEGILVQNMAKGKEVIIGVKRDPQFGPIIMFGIGGIFVEVLKDVSFRIAPIDKKDAFRMIEEVKGSVLLKGYRGQKKVNLNAIADILVKTSKLVLKNKRIAEMDMNPVFVDGKGAKVADVRILVQ